MPGLDRHTGVELDDFAHVQQSIEDILTTPIGTRVIRRRYGSELYELVDRPIDQFFILRATYAIALALDEWEPRVDVARVSIDEAGPAGKLALRILVNYYPRGHLGDFTLAQEREVGVAL